MVTAILQSHMTRRVILMDYDIQLVVIDAKRPAWETSPVVRYGTTPKSVKRTATFFGVLIAIVAISALFITAL